MNDKNRPSVLIAGLGDGLGLGLAKVFAEAGYDVVGLARSEHVESRAAGTVNATGRTYTHLSVDLTDSAQCEAALAPVAQSCSIAIYTAHSLLIAPFEETAPADVERLWRVGCLGAVHMARAVLPSMADRGAGTLILTGATAGIRGGANFAAFASAKFALRGLAQALAREYGPKGVHVAHTILDGLIDEPQTTARFGEGDSQRMSPDAIARTYLDLTRQDPSAWTHELDLRPATERF